MQYIRNLVGAHRRDRPRPAAGRAHGHGGGDPQLVGEHGGPAHARLLRRQQCSRSTTSCSSTAGVRRDAASAFGNDFRAVYYPKLGASWLALRAGLLPEAELASTRSAFAPRTARRARSRARPTRCATSRPFSATLPNGSDAPSLSLGVARQREAQARVLGRDRGRLRPDAVRRPHEPRPSRSTTRTRRTRSSAGTSRRRSPASRAASRTSATSQNSGFELEVNQTIVDRTSFGASFTLTGSTNKNRMTTLAPGVSAIFTGNRNTQRNQPGYPLFGLWSRTLHVRRREQRRHHRAQRDDVQRLGVSSSARRFRRASSRSRRRSSCSNRKLRISGQIDCEVGLQEVQQHAAPPVSGRCVVPRAVRQERVARGAGGRRRDEPAGRLPRHVRGRRLHALPRGVGRLRGPDAVRECILRASR